MNVKLLAIATFAIGAVLSNTAQAGANPDASDIVLTCPHTRISQSQAQRLLGSSNPFGADAWSMWRAQNYLQHLADRACENGSAFVAITSKERSVPTAEQSVAQVTK